MATVRNFNEFKIVVICASGFMNINVALYRIVIYLYGSRS